MFLKSKRNTTTEVGGFNVKISTLVDTDDYCGSVSTTDKVKKALKKKTKSFKIFRRISSSNKKETTADGYNEFPCIQPGLTWTNSEDSSVMSGASSLTNGSMTQEIHADNSSTALLVPSASFINNQWHEHVPSKGLDYLMAKHKTELEEKQIEIEVMQDQIVLLNEKNMKKNDVINAMKEQHELAMHEKIMEMKSIETRMVIMNSQHEEEIEILESAVREKDNEIIDLKAKLNCTKAELFEVSSTLIQTQHKLHDVTNSWPYKFFL